MRKKISAINTLIMSVGRKTPLIFSFQKAYKKLKIKGKIIGIDADKYAVGLQFVDIAKIVPLYNDQVFLNTFKKLLKQFKIDLIIPTSDDDLYFLNKYRNELNDLPLKIIISSEQVIAFNKDKNNFFEFCKKHSIPTLKIFPLEKLRSQEKLPFPFFINSAKGKGSRFAQKIENHEELRFFLKVTPKPIVSQFIDGQEYSVDCFCDFDGKIISIIPRQRLFTWGGEAFVTQTKKNKIIIKATQDFLEKISCCGPTNIQCFLTKQNEVVFFEINPRFGGASRLSFEAGANTPKYLLQLFMGQKIPSRIGQFKDNFTMLRFKDDLFIDAKKL